MRHFWKDLVISKFEQNVFYGMFILWKIIKHWSSFLHRNIQPQNVLPCITSFQIIFQLHHVLSQSCGTQCHIFPLLVLFSIKKHETLILKCNIHLHFCYLLFFNSWKTNTHYSTTMWMWMMWFSWWYAKLFLSLVLQLHQRPNQLKSGKNLPKRYLNFIAWFICVTNLMFLSWRCCLSTCFWCT